MANAGRPPGDNIPAELRHQAYAAAYSSVNEYCHKEHGKPEQWATQFWSRSHLKFAPYARMAAALEVSAETLAGVIESGDFRAKVLQKFSTLQKFAEAAKVSRNLIEDCSAARCANLCIFTYRTTMHQVGLSLDTLAKRVLN